MFWLFITMGLCGISQWFNRRLAASVGTLLVVGCLMLGNRQKEPIPSIIDISQPPQGAGFVSLSTSSYHRPGCPMIRREKEFATSAEAARILPPCPLCIKEASGQELSHYTPLLQTTAR